MISTSVRGRRGGVKYIKLIDLSLTLIFLVPKFFQIPQLCKTGYGYVANSLSQLASFVVIGRMVGVSFVIWATIRTCILASFIWRMEAVWSGRLS